jgi:hypothetical protein
MISRAILCCQDSRRPSMTELRQWAMQWGDIASIVGALLTFIGFVIAIIGISRSKSAAEQAKKAAEEARDSISRYDAIADLSAAMTIMEEIKRLQRNGVWTVLPERYSELQRRLRAKKESEINISEAQRQKLEVAIGTFADSERKVERAVFGNVGPPNPAKLNDIISGQIAEVHVVLLALQQIEH